MNRLDEQYTNLLQDILNNGVKKGDRTGTGTISVFGRQIRHKMSDGFPLITTKKMYWKGIVTELLWFLRGDTNIKYLVDNDCHIWDGDCYKAFHKEASDIKILYENGDLLGTQPYVEEMFSNPDELIILTKEEFIDKIKINDTFAENNGDLGKIYGHQWRKWPKFGYWEEYDALNNSSFTVEGFEYVDQIANLIDKLKTNPDDRRMIVTAWNPAEVDNCVLPPCHYGFQCYTRELTYNERCDLYIKKYGEFDIHPFQGKDIIMDDFNIPRRAISLKWNQRSVDTPLGLPFNIASYGLLLEIIAKVVNMVPDELIGDLGDTHIYLNQIEGVEEQIGRSVFDLPHLRINTEFWLTKTGECGVGELSDSVVSLISGMEIDDFQIENYKSHPSIKFPLSN